MHGEKFKRETRLRDREIKKKRERRLYHNVNRNTE